MDIWQLWNDSLAHKMSQGVIDLADQADYLTQAVEESRGRADRPAL